MASPSSPVLMHPRILQRKCGCGGSANLTGECSECQSKRLTGKPLQGKLSIGEPGDEYEREADRVADQVMRMAGPASEMAASKVPMPLPLQRDVSASTAGPTTALAIFGDLLSSPGQPLDAATRAFFEPRFGHDFSRVRVHSDSRAAESARAVKAFAYTVDNHVAFADGQYQPGTLRGKQLLAHELTHIVQQAALSDEQPVLRRQTRGMFEERSGVSKGMRSKDENGTPLFQQQTTLEQTYTAVCSTDSGGCDVEFKIGRAFAGEYPYFNNDANKKRGVYLEISAQHDRSQCPCTHLHLIQTVRNTKMNPRLPPPHSSRLITADPLDPLRQLRSGWNDPNESSRGWRVDVPNQDIDPFFTPAPRGETDMSVLGSATKPAIMWDAPGDDITAINVGKTFQTCAVCEDKMGSKKVLACLFWGYFIDSSGKPHFTPAVPTVKCGATKELRDADTRWKSIAGNQTSDITF